MAGFEPPPVASTPLCHGFVGVSRNVNQMIICTRVSFSSFTSACVMYVACFESVTPSGPGGFVWYAYSVTHIGMFLRLNHLSSDFSNSGIS